MSTPNLRSMMTIADYVWSHDGCKISEVMHGTRASYAQVQEAIRLDFIRNTSESGIPLLTIGEKMDA